MTGQDFDVAILAAIIHHELAHLQGAGEAEARRSERGFFQSLIRDGRVPVEQGLRYLAHIEQEWQHTEG
jgi:hypothetical protein